jgi:hypothetical protein
MALVERSSMDYKVQVLSSDALTTSVYPAVANEVLEEGDTVVMTASGWDKTAAESAIGGIVIRGNVDDKSVAIVQKPIVCLSSAILRIDASKVDTIAGLSVGSLVNFGANGKIALVSAEDAAGYVLEKDGTSSIVVVLK